MPGGDRRGPLGMGPMTGRAAGFCAGYSAPGYMNPAFGPGFGRGRGRGGMFGGGRGWRNWYYATGLTGWQRAMAGMPPHGYTPPAAAPAQAPPNWAMSKNQELDELKGQAEYLEDALDGVKKRISELESEQAK